jgi:hypothetical protein
MTRLCAEDFGRPCQGAIYRDIFYLDRVDLNDEYLIVQRVLFPYVCILTQECDLAFDYDARWGEESPAHYGKALLSVLAAPLYTADQLASGSHLDRLKIPSRDAQFTCEKFTDKKGKLGRRWSWLKQNDNPRYHYMAFSRESGLPAVVMDFKHYFTLSVELLATEWADRRLGQLEDLERADLSQRFASFLARVGLPPSPAAED